MTPVNPMLAGEGYRKMQDVIEREASVIRSESAQLEIYVVDDDAAIRQIISTILSREGYAVTCFVDGPSLLKAVRDKSPACILLDINLPGRSGLEILDDLQAISCAAPVLMVSGKGELAVAVESLKRGARDYIEKPFRGGAVVGSVNEVLARSLKALRKATVNFPGCESLTPREKQVLEQCITGATAKESAKNLQMSPRTVEDHRSNIIRKLGARNTADVIRLALTSAIVS